MCFPAAGSYFKIQGRVLYNVSEKEILSDTGRKIILDSCMEWKEVNEYLNAAIQINN